MIGYGLIQYNHSRQKEKQRARLAKENLERKVSLKFFQKSGLNKILSVNEEDQKKLDLIASRPGFIPLSVEERDLVRLYRH